MKASTRLRHFAASFCHLTTRLRRALSIGMIFDVDNHPMAYVLLVQTLPEKISARVRTEKNDCELEEGYQRDVIHGGILRF
jgi:hypothetical protein